MSALRPTGAVTQPAVDPGSTPTGPDQCDPRCFYRDRGVEHDAPEDCRYAEPNGGVKSCWSRNATAKGRKS